MGIFLGTLHDLPISLSICWLVVSILSGDGYRIRMYSVWSYANLVKITCCNSILQIFFLNLIIFSPVICSPQSFDFFFQFDKKQKWNVIVIWTYPFIFGGGCHFFAFHINWWCVLWFFLGGVTMLFCPWGSLVSLWKSCVRGPTLWYCLFVHCCQCSHVILCYVKWYY